MKKNGKFKPGVSGNETAKWRPGQSGNPAGKSKRRTQFEEAFNEALISRRQSRRSGQAALGGRARQRALGDPGTVPAVRARNPIPTMVHEVEDDGFDYSRLTDEQIKQLEAILEQAGVPALSALAGRRKPDAAFVNLWHRLGMCWNREHRSLTAFMCKPSAITCKLSAKDGSGI